MNPPAFVLKAGGLAALLLQASWGLDRIERVRVPLTGRGVHAYVVDTGVRKSHEDFGGRADWIGDFVGGAPRSGDAEDCDPSDGHGTHVADILGGRRFGVAAGASIHALRILPCTGTTRTEIDAAVRAVEWITAHGRHPAVVNISPARWDTADTTLDAAVERSIRAGFVYVLSAGGVGDVTRFTPQRVADAITVASMSPDNRAVGTRYGPQLTLFAPGVGIEAAGRGSDSATFAADGDSYAAPFAAGAAALYLEAHPAATPAQVKGALVAGAARDVLTNAGDAPNRLLRAIQ